MIRREMESFHFVRRRRNVAEETGIQILSPQSHNLFVSSLYIMHHALAFAFHISINYHIDFAILLIARFSSDREVMLQKQSGKAIQF